MKKTLFLVLSMFSGFVFAQTCDVTYTTEAETKEGKDVVMAKAVVYGLPKADVEDNSKKGMRVIDLASKLQDKGGPYTVEFGEWRSCDGKPAEKFAANSIQVQGVTLNGLNRLARLSNRVAEEITTRYEVREQRGDKHAWDHGKARKVKRDDLHVKQW